MHNLEQTTDLTDNQEMIKGLKTPQVTEIIEKDIATKTALTKKTTITKEKLKDMEMTNTPGNHFVSRFKNTLETAEADYWLARDQLSLSEQFSFKKYEKVESSEKVINKLKINTDKIVNNFVNHLDKTWISWDSGIRFMNTLANEISNKNTLFDWDAVIFNDSYIPYYNYVYKNPTYEKDRSKFQKFCCRNNKRFPGFDERLMDYFIPGVKNKM